MAEAIKKNEENVPVQRRQSPARFGAMQDMMDRMMDDLFGHWPMMRVRPREWRMQYFSPSMDVVEEDNRVLVNLEVPGMGPDDIDITVAHDAITITGEKKSEQEEERQGAHYSERSYGSFRRQVPIDEGIDRDRIAAGFKNGVLTLTLPKSHEAVSRTRKIRITSEAGQRPADLMDTETMGAAEAIEQEEYPERDPYRQKQTIRSEKPDKAAQPAGLQDTETMGAAEAIEQQEQTDRTKTSR